MQNTVTKPVEEAVSSTSQEGISMVTLTLKSGTDVTTVQKDAERKINEMKGTLPTDADNPIIRKFNADELPVVCISATSNLSKPQLYDLPLYY